MRRSLRLVLATAVAAVSLAACGSPTPAPLPAAPAPSQVAVAPDPSMVMITLADRGYLLSTITLNESQPVMLMIVNRGTRPHSLSAAIPVSALTVEDTASPGPAPAVTASPDLDINVAPGHEIDVMFAPTHAGRFALDADGSSAGAFVVA